MARPKPSKVPAQRSSLISDAPAPPTARAILTGLSIALLVLVVYRRALDNQFVWQDVATIQRDVTTAPDSLPSERWVCPPSAEASSPLVRGAFRVEHRLWGLSPRGYHVVSAIAHAVSALLFWRLLALFAVPGAGLAALIFAAHPLGVVSVAWVAATGTVVSCMLCLATMLALWESFTHGEDNARLALTSQPRVTYVLAIGLYTLALGSDPISVALPAVLLVLEWWKFGHLTRRLLLDVAPFAVLAVLATLFQVANSGAGSAAQTSVAMHGTSIALAGRAFWFYVGKIFWPDPLNLIYHRWEGANGAWRLCVPPAGVLALIGGLWWLRARIGRGPCAGTTIFAIVLLTQLVAAPATSIADAIVADHLAYHASLALIALTAAAIVLALRSMALEKTLFVAAASIAVIAPLAVFAERRTHAFHDRVALDNDTLLHNPDAWMAHHDLAAVQRDQGDLDAAIQGERRTIEILERRRAANPAHGDDADNLAGCYGQLALFLGQLGKTAEANAARSQAIAIREELVRQVPDAPAYHDHLAWDYTDRAYAERDRGQAVDALGWFRKAIVEQDVVLESHPARYSTLNNLATNYVDVGILELDQNLGNEAQASFARARELRELLVGVFPDDPTYRDGLAWCYVDLALVESWLAKPDAAVRMLSNAVALREQLVRDNPGVTDYQERLAVLYSDIGLKERQLENLAEAEQAFQNALELRQRLASEHPNVEGYQDSLAASHVDIGSIQHVRGQLSAAESSCREAIAIRDQLVRRQPDSGHYAQRLAASYAELGILLREEERVDESLAACRRAIEICQKLVRNTPDNANYQAGLSWAYENLGVSQIANREAAAAADACSTAVRISEEIVRKSGEAIGPRTDLARAISNLAKAQFANGQLAAAEENHRKAIEELAQLTQYAPGIDEYKHLTAMSCHSLADVLRSAGRRQGAAALYQAAIDIHESLITQKSSKKYESSLTDDLLAAAEVLAETGDWAGSATAYAKACKYDHTVKAAVAHVLVQLAAHDETGYRESCTRLIREYGNDVSSKSSFVVALALVAGKCNIDDAQATISIARHAAVASVHPGANILVAAAQYRAGMIGDAVPGLAESLDALNTDEDAPDRSIVVRLIGTMLLARAYRDQGNAAACAAEISRLDELIIESLVVGTSAQDDGLPPWSVRLAVEIAQRELASLRHAQSAR